MTEVAEKELMVVFPGQGSQYAGMGSDIYERFEVVRSVYQRASEALKYDVAELSFKDPEDQLNLTEYTQPALLTHSYACLQVLNELLGEPIRPAVYAGHSLGEYSALVASGALTFEEALCLVQRRGALMGTYGRGKMVALVADLELVRTFVDRFYCGVGGCNLPMQTVVGGAEVDVKRLKDYAESEHQLRATLLNTQGAFHTYLMIGAAEHFRFELEKVEFARPNTKIMSNYLGTYHEPDDLDEIRAHLFFQLFNPVKWIWGMKQALSDGVNVVVELGGGIGPDGEPSTKTPNLRAITRRAFRELSVRGTHLPGINCETLEKTAEHLRA